jgi:hypothetical protein
MILLSFFYELLVKLLFFSFLCDDTLEGLDFMESTQEEITQDTSASLVPLSGKDAK